ncbi:MAG: PQQ-binding-like beta-propeller repeat protein [Polyangiaceae bacterium]
MVRTAAKRNSWQPFSVEINGSTFTGTPYYAGLVLSPAASGASPQVTVNIGIIGGSWAGQSGIQASVSITGAISSSATFAPGSLTPGLSLVDSADNPLVIEVDVPGIGTNGDVGAMLVAALAETLSFLPLGPSVPQNAPPPFNVTELVPWVVPGTTAGATQLLLALKTTTTIGEPSQWGLQTFPAGSTVALIFSTRLFIQYLVLNNLIKALVTYGATLPPGAPFDFASGTWTLASEPSIQVPYTIPGTNINLTFDFDVSAAAVTVDPTASTVALRISLDFTGMSPDGGGCKMVSFTWSTVQQVSLGQSGTAQASIAVTTIKQGFDPAKSTPNCRGVGDLLSAIVTALIPEFNKLIAQNITPIQGPSLATFGDMLTLNALELSESGQFALYGAAHIDLGELGVPLANVGNTGEYPAQVMPGQTLLWKYALPQPPGSAPPMLTADDTQVYLTDGGGTLVALDQLTGAVRWSVANQNMFSPTIVIDGVVLAVGGNFGSGVLNAYDAVTGVPLWSFPGVQFAQGSMGQWTFQYPMPWQAASGVAAARAIGGTQAPQSHVLVQVNQGGVAPFGVLAYGSASGPAPIFTPLGMNNTLDYGAPGRVEDSIYLAAVVTGGGGAIIAWDVAMDTPLPSQANQLDAGYPSVWVTPVVAAEGMLYGTLANGQVVCINPTGGTNPAWIFPASGQLNTVNLPPPVVADGVVVVVQYVPSQNGQTVCAVVGLNAETGAQVWAVPTNTGPAPGQGNFGPGGFCASDGYVVGAINGVLTALLLASGQPGPSSRTWVGPNGNICNIVPPVIANSRLFAMDLNYLYCFA